MLISGKILGAGPPPGGAATTMAYARACRTHPGHGPYSTVWQVTRDKAGGAPTSVVSPVTLGLLPKSGMEVACRIRRAGGATDEITLLWPIDTADEAV